MITATTPIATIDIALIMRRLLHRTSQLVERDYEDAGYFAVSCQDVLRE